MTAPGRTRGRGLGALLGLSLLAIPGFALGGLAGLLWEDPALVGSYLLGRTQVVAWTAQDSGDAVPQVAAEPPETGDASAEALPAVAAAPAGEPEPAPGSHTAPPPQTAPPRAGPAGRFAVQVGAFGEKPAADRLAASLREKGYGTYVASGSGAGTWRVRVGPLASREEGERVGARLKREERLPTWVLEEER